MSLRSLVRDLADALAFLPEGAVVALVAALPILELRGSIPLAAFHYDMGWAEAFTWSLLGNLAAVPIVWVVLPHAERLVRRIPAIDRALNWLFERTRRKASPKVERYEEAALLALVALPVPGTGAWTGVLVAYLFGLSWRKAAPMIFAGIVIAGFLVVLLTYGAKAVF